MRNIALAIIALAACVEYAAAVNCTVMADGNYELGCRSFAKCASGQVSIIDCPTDTVYNNQTGMCDEAKNVSPPCGHLIDCSNTPDGRFADKDQNCKTWYTCQDNKFLGHNFCPEGTVFDEGLSTCNWAAAVAPPCGTLTGK